MKIVQVRKTFMNEGVTVRPARPGKDPVTITVSDTRAKELIASGLVGEPEDAPEPEGREREELLVRGIAGMTLDSSDGNVVTIRLRTARQAEVFRQTMRDAKDSAAAHIEGRREAGEVIDEDEGETAAGVIFSDLRDRASRPVGGSDEKTEELVRTMSADLAKFDQTVAELTARAEKAEAELAERIAAEASRTGSDDPDPAEATNAGPSESGDAAATSAETASAAETPPKPVEGRKPRGNRTGEAAE